MTTKRCVDRMIHRCLAGVLASNKEALICHGSIKRWSQYKLLPSIRTSFALVCLGSERTDSAQAMET
jgi:hypothetical protein